MLATQLNTAVASLQNLVWVSLHTDDPGNLGDNDSGLDKQPLVWSTPSGGWMKATATFEDIEGIFTHIGLWDDDGNFVVGRTLNVNLPSSQNLVVLVEFRVEVRA